MFYCEACGKPRHHHDHGFYALAGTEFDGICEDCAQNSEDVQRCATGHYWLTDEHDRCPTCGEPDENDDGPPDRPGSPSPHFDEQRWLDVRNEARWRK